MVVRPILLFCFVLSTVEKISVQYLQGFLSVPKYNLTWLIDLQGKQQEAILLTRKTERQQAGSNIQTADCAPPPSTAPLL